MIIKYLDAAIYWLIIFIPFSIAISPAITHTFIGFMIFCFLLKKIFKRERLFMNTPLNLPFLFLVLIAFISFKNSINYFDSLHGIIKFARNAFIFLICAEEIKEKKHISRVIMFIILGATLASVDALWQIAFGRDFIRGNELQSAIGLIRATASFPNPNVFGVYLSAISPLVIGLSLYYFKGRAKVIMLMISFLVTLGIISTFSRGTGLGLYVAMLFLYIARKQKLLLFVLIIVLLIYPFVMPKNIKDWAKEVKYNPLVFMCNYDRISIYKNSLNMIKHHPFIGVGVNTFSKNYFQYKLPEIGEEYKTGDHMYAHNHFLQMAGEIGLLGLGIFFWLLFRLFKKCTQIYKNLKDEYLKIISLSLTACLIAFLTNGLTETSLYYARVAMIFWFLIGFVLSLDKFTDAYQQGKD